MCTVSKRYHRWRMAMEEEKRRDRERKAEAARRALIEKQDKDIDLD